MDLIEGIDELFVTIALSRATTGTDGWNNPTQTYASAGTIQGLIRKVSGDEPHTAGKDTPIGQYRLYCRKTTLLNSDRVTLGTDAYEIKDINDVMNFGVLMQVDLEKIG